VVTNRLEARDPADVLEELEREKHVVETLYRVAEVVARKQDLREIVQFVTDESTKLTGAQFGAFFYNVVRRDGNEYALYTISGAPLSAFERFPMPRATEIFRPTFEGTATIRLDDVKADPRYGKNAPHHGMPPGHLPVRSYLAVPVFALDGSVVGGLFFGHEEVGVFSSEHERIATGIATHAGIAIDKARLLDAERTARAEAEARADAAVALEFVEDGIVVVDGGGHVRLWNRAAAAITGLAATTVLGRPIGEAVPGWERIVLDIPVGDLTENVVPATLPLDTLQGREVWLSLYGVAFEDGTVYAFRDVTARQELDAFRADVVATVSHELRTPIAAIYGAARTLRHRKLAPRLARQLLTMVDSEAERLARLVEEILLTSQIDSGSMVLEPTSLDPAEAIARACAAATDEEALSLEIEEGVTPVVADPEKLRQVLGNLIENALKYGRATGSPRIVVRARTRGSRVRFEVADDGPGIPRGEQGRVFEKFYRLDPHLRQGVGGTGLGLYICRELVERMHGTIGVDSVEGVGATFWFELPRA
jgi:PAS domain S-box-containing protein